MSLEADHSWMRGVQEALASGDLVQPPDWVRKRAKQIFQSTRPSIAERIRALLVFDSRQPGLSHIGLRSAAVVDGPWQLLYRGDDVDIDLLVRPNLDGHTSSVRGQALPLSGASIDAGVVEALPADQIRLSDQDDAASIRSELDPRGEFALSNLERGRYDVLVRLGARQIELSGVEF
jgi:hypothetical protein